MRVQLDTGAILEFDYEATPEDIAAAAADYESRLAPPPANPIKRPAGTKDAFTRDEFEAKNPPSWWERTKSKMGIKPKSTTFSIEPYTGPTGSPQQGYVQAPGQFQARGLPAYISETDAQGNNIAASRQFIEDKFRRENPDQDYGLNTAKAMRSHYGSRLDEAHLQLIYAFANTTHADRRMIHELVQAGDYDSMRSVIGLPTNGHARPKLTGYNDPRTWQSVPYSKMQFEIMLADTAAPGIPLVSGQTYHGKDYIPREVAMEQISRRTGIAQDRLLPNFRVDTEHPEYFASGFGTTATPEQKAQAIVADKIARNRDPGRQLVETLRIPGAAVRETMSTIFGLSLAAQQYTSGGTLKLSRSEMESLYREARKSPGLQFTGYFVPVAGQAAFYSDMASVGADALRKNSTEPLAEFAEGFVQGFNVLEDGIGGEERAVRAVNLILALKGGRHFVDKKISEPILRSSLEKTYGLTPEQAQRAIGWAQDAVRSGYVPERLQSGVAKPVGKFYGEVVAFLKGPSAVQPGRDVGHQAQKIVRTEGGTRERLDDWAKGQDAKADFQNFLDHQYTREAPVSQPAAAPHQAITHFGLSKEPGLAAAATTTARPIPEAGPIERQRTSAEGFPFYDAVRNPKDIGVYPGLQYKKAGIVDSKNAVTSALKGVEKYDPATAGPLTVWQRTDGSEWVMNGHHRRELAIRTDEPNVDVRVFKETDGVDFETARALGALQNIKDDKGTALDAATVVRDLKVTVKDLAGYGVNMRSGVGRDAVALLRLHPDAFAYVEDGSVHEKVAAAIAEAGLDPKRQVAAMRQADGLETRTQGEFIARKALTAETVKGETGDLFGDAPENFAWKEQARIAEGVLRRLQSDQRLYNSVAKGKAVGETTVDAEAQKRAAMVEETARHVLAYDQETAATLEREAITYAKQPRKAQFDLAVRKVAERARAAAVRKLEELGQLGPGAADRDGGRSEGGRIVEGEPQPVSRSEPAQLEPSAESPGPLIDVPQELVLSAPESPKPSIPTTSTAEQPGMFSDGEARGEARLDLNKDYATGLPNRDIRTYSPEEFKTRIDAITKLIRGGGASVFKDLRRLGVRGLFENPNRKFRFGRVRISDLSLDQFADTLAHEAAHQMDSIISTAAKKLLDPEFQGVSPATGKIETLFGVTDKDLATKIRQEMIEVTTALVGKRAVEEMPGYFLNDKELYARLMQSAIFHPGLIEEFAPTAFEHLVKMAEQHPQLYDYLQIARGAMVDHPQAFFFIPDARQGYIKRLDHYLGTRAYGEEVLYRARRAQAIAETDQLIKDKFAGVKDRQETLFDAAEGILRTVDGVPQFGTKVRTEVDMSGVDLELFQAIQNGETPLNANPKEVRRAQKAADEVGAYHAAGYQYMGVSAEGNILFENWRKTPKEAQMAYESLSEPGKALIREYTADLAEAKDLFNREFLKSHFKIESDLEGWVHHYFEDKQVGTWRSPFLRDRKAAATKKRGEAEGYSKDFKTATQKAITELRIADAYNEFIHKQLALVAEPLVEGESPKPGWVEISGNTRHGFDLPGRRRLMLEEGGSVKIGKRYQIQIELYERYVKERLFTEEVKTAQVIVNSLNRYWQGNILVHPGTAMTNLVSGGIQLGGKMLTDFYLDLFDAPTGGRMDRTIANVAGMMETLTPEGWKGAPDWVYGGEKTNFYGQFMSKQAPGFDNAADKVIDKALAGYQGIERLFKKIIINQEKRTSSASDPLKDPEFIKHVNDVIDLWAYDYANVPNWLDGWRKNPAGGMVKPFATYPYKMVKMLTSMVGGAFDKNLPAKERAAKIMALATIFTAYGIFKRSQEERQTVGKVSPDPAQTFDETKLKSAVNPRGRLFMGRDGDGNEVFVRTAKYPFLNVFDAFDALVHGDTKGVADMVTDQLGTLGPLGKFTANNVFGMRGEFDTYKDRATVNAETAASFVPLGRVMKDMAEVLDPKKRELPRNPLQVFGQYVPTTDEKLRERLAGPEQTIDVPMTREEAALADVDDREGLLASIRANLGEKAASIYEAYLNERDERGAGGSPKKAVTVPVPKNTQDALWRMLGGVVIKRIDPIWYGRFVERLRENERAKARKTAGLPSAEEE